MLIIRTLQAKDLDDLYSMAKAAGNGMTSLPADRELLERKIARAQDAFTERAAPEHRLYLFALEDTALERCVGISGIEARVGLDEVFYNYRVSTVVNSSRELGVHVQTPTLHLSNDMTDTSEICSLLLGASHRGGGNGLLLSRCRFMYLDDFSHLFSEKVFAEMRGVSDSEGRSPLWDALGSKFFDMEFTQADVLTGLGNKSFIAELMPKYPIYLPMLRESARAVIGQVHENTAPALAMLKAEGFNYNGLVDIFDGGPVVEAFIASIRTIRSSVTRTVKLADKPIDLEVPAKERVMISNRSFSDFRVTTLPVSCVGREQITVPREMASLLRLDSGDAVRVAPLKDSRPLVSGSAVSPQEML
ncbi:arginine N-succinyltransferase [Gilvimarinus sp. F26214L]|uniref:arginine N-succinyltransferase n=1 Tax=Gilvimarinus sp. DZF01 TaxID=3461371 RepID=UPI00404624A2